MTEYRLYNHVAGLFFIRPNSLTSVSERSKLFPSAIALYKAKQARTFPNEWWCLYLDAGGLWRVAGKPNETLRLL